MRICTCVGFELVDGDLGFERLTLGVILYIILLYYILLLLSYTILYYIYLYSSPIPLFLYTLLIYHLFLLFLFFSSIPSPSSSLYSFYTCRYLDTHIYILPKYLTPHVLSEGCLEWCSFICVVFGSGGWLRCDVGWVLIFRAGVIL